VLFITLQFIKLLRKQIKIHQIMGALLAAAANHLILVTNALVFAIGICAQFFTLKATFGN